MTTNTDFLRLLSAAKILGASGDVPGAKTLIAAAAALLPTSNIGLCGKCSARLERNIQALREVEEHLRDGAAADGKAEQVATAR